MPHVARLTELAEALADGRAPDWEGAEHFSSDPVERGMIAQLRAVGAIHKLYTTHCDSLGDAAGRTRLMPGAVWGGLEIRGHVGRGRFGDVYRAWDPALDRDVALKLVRHVGTESAETKIVDEGRLMARVRHPNVVVIHGAQRLDGVTGLWMEFVEGSTLASELAERGPFAAADLIQVAIELSRALSAVHRAGLVHRDVKTQNVLRDATGRIVLGDFGTGRELDAREDAAGMAGTPAYLAPEIFERLPATPQSDLYSLGALLFHLATGRFPVPGRSMRELRDAHAEGKRTPLHQLRPDLSSAWCGCIDRVLERDPAKRFAHADEMLAALEGAGAREVRPSRSRKAVGAAAAIVVTVVLVLAWMTRSDPTASAVPFVPGEFVLVTSFDNRSGDELLDGTLEYALERELSTSSFINVLSRSRLQDTLALMRTPVDVRVDGRLGREIALRDPKIRAVIEGRIERVGTNYAVTADVVSPEGVRLAGVHTSAVTQRELLSAIRELATQIREQLGESLATTAPSPTTLPRISTSSLRALQLYQRARALAGDEGGVGIPNAATVEQMLRESLREDPDFVMAHIMLSHALRNQPNKITEAIEQLDQALKAAERGTAVDRAIARAEWHGTQALFGPFTERRGHREQAAAAFEAALQLQPDDEWALGCLTNAYPVLGRYRDALGAAERLVTLRPHSLTALWRAARAAFADGQLDVAAGYAERAAGLDVVIDERNASQYAWVRTFAAHRKWLAGDPSGAQIVADAVAQTMPRYSPAVQSVLAQHLTPIYLQLGQLRRAEALAASILSPADPRFALTRVLRETGDRQRLRRLILRDDLRSLAVPNVNIISMIIEAGMLSLADETLARADSMTTVPPAYLRLVRGKLALAHGRPREAIRQLEVAVEVSQPWRGTNIWSETAMTMARALSQTGDTARAIDVLEDASRDPLEYDTSQGSRWLTVRDQLAQLYRRAGRLNEADRADVELRAMLVVADDEHPIKRRVTTPKSAGVLPGVTGVGGSPGVP